MTPRALAWGAIGSLVLWAIIVIVWFSVVWHTP